MTPTALLPGRILPGGALLRLWRDDSLRGRFARGAAWSVAGACVSQGSNLAASVALARLLGRERFGEYGMLQNTAVMFGVLAGMGLGLTATKYVAELRTADPERAGRVVALSGGVALGAAALAAAGLLGAAPWLAAGVLNAPHLAPELRLAAGVLFLNALNGTQAGVLAGFEAFRALARVNLIRGALAFPLAVAGALLWDLRGAVAALMAAAAAGCILNRAAIRAECSAHRVPVRWRGAWSARGFLWRFSLPAFLGSAMTGPALWAASSVLVNQPGGYAEMALFSAANQWRTAVAFLPSLLAQPLLSLLSNAGTADPGAFRRLLRANLALSFGLTVAAAAPVLLCSSWIMQAYGDGFLAGRPVLILLVLATVISSTAAVIGQGIAGLDRMWWGFALNAVWAAALLGGAAWLAPRHGALGLAVAFLASYSVHALTVTAYVRRQLRGRLGRCA